MNLDTIRDAIAVWVAGASGLPVLWAGKGAPRPSAPYVSMRLTSLRAVGDDWSDKARNPLVLADDVVESVDAGADTLTLTGHAYETGDGPVRLTTTGTLPAGLALLTDYWIVVISSSAIKLAANFPDAIAASPTTIDITSAGSGTHTISDTLDTLRAGEEVEVTVRGQRSGTLTLQCFGNPDPTAASSAAPEAILEVVRAKYSLPSYRDALEEAGVGLGEFGEVLAIDGDLGFSLFEPRAIMEVAVLLAQEISELEGMIVYVGVDIEDEDDNPLGTVWVPEDPGV